MEFDATYVLVQADTTYVAIDASTVTNVLMDASNQTYNLIAAGNVLFGRFIQDYCDPTYFAETYVEVAAFSPY